jgi:hypothetical protein
VESTGALHERLDGIFGEDAHGFCVDDMRAWNKLTKVELAKAYLDMRDMCEGWRSANEHSIEVLSSDSELVVKVDGIYKRPDGLYNVTWSSEEGDFLRVTALEAHMVELLTGAKLNENGIPDMTECDDTVIGLGGGGKLRWIHPRNGFRP